MSHASQQTRRWVVAGLLAVVAVVIAALATSTSLDWGEGRVRKAAPVVTEPSALSSVTASWAQRTQQQPQATGSTPSYWLPVLLGGFVLLAIALLVHRIAPRLRWPGRRRQVTGVLIDAPEVIGEDVADQLAQPMAAALSELRAGRSVTDVIIDCWLALEQAAGISGHPRRPSQTATEYTLDLLAATAADDNDLSELADLYRQAMFAALPPGPASAERAEQCLQNLLTALGGGRA